MAGIGRRGALIQPLIVELQQLDRQATVEAGGYHPTFREPRPVITNAGRANETRTDTRIYKEPTLRLRAQIEEGMYRSLQMQPTGNNPDSRLTVALFQKDLEQRGLVEEGRVLFGVGDKLIAIYNRNGSVARRIQYPPGLYVKEVRPAGEGQGGYQNLTLLIFEQRDEGVPR